MRLLFCCLLLLCSTLAISQNVGINTTTPQKTLHINGELKVDSASYLRKVYLKNALDSTRMVLDPDNGALEFWDNDTLWYQLKVASPPSELRNGGNYTVERDWGQDYNGDPAIVTTYKNAAGEIVRTDREVIVENSEDDDDLTINELYEDGCLAERTIQHGISGGTTREIYDCPSGTLCLKEEKFTSNSTLNTNLSTTTTLTDVKNGKELSSVTTGQTILGKFTANKKFTASTVGNQLLGGMNLLVDTCQTFSIFGKNNEGLSIKVSDLIVNPNPGLQLFIDEDNKQASFCNTSELEQKIDSTLRRRGIIDNGTKSFSTRVQTPGSWLESKYQPNDGIYGQISSESVLAYSRIFDNQELKMQYADLTGLSVMRNTFNPDLKFMEFNHSENPLRYNYQWLSTPNITFMQTVIDTASNKSIHHLHQPDLQTLELTHSSSPIFITQTWDIASSSFIKSVRDTSNNSQLSCTSVPSQSIMAYSAGSPFFFSHQFDTTNNIYTKKIEDPSSSQLMSMSFDPQSAIMSRDAGSDLQFIEQFNIPQNQLWHITDNGSTGANIFSWMQPELMPAQSRWEVGANQNNLNIDFFADMNLFGNFSKFSGSFKIDHPLDPYNKYLVHSFVESPDMMNIYNGNITTNGDGIAVIELPDYFDALNIEPRYQLTVIGSFDQAIVYKEVKNNQFTIKTSAPEVKVSWQVTGIRNDDYARENRLEVEVEKEVEKKGTLMYEGVKD